MQNSPMPSSSYTEDNKGHSHGLLEENSKSFYAEELTGTLYIRLQGHLIKETSRLSYTEDLESF